ncbi:MAG: condensation domain-containing protein, partial [Acidobacteria bacterium]|nr:condensation domain-containing protein [Acidobacteriota bacterium]
YILQSPVNYREPHEPGTDSPVKETGHSRLLSERPALTTSYAAPQNKIEQQLVRIWENFFGIGMIGTNDDFFELGGDSLKATGMIAKIHKEMNLKIELAEVFKNPNIARLAAYALSIQPLMYEAIPPVEKKQYYELSYSQQRLWFISRTEIDNPLFNMREAMILPDRFDENLIRKVWQQLSMRHESLRTAFKEIVRVPVQVILPIESLELDIEVIDLIGIPGVQQDQARIEIFKNESLHVFNLERAPLYRIKIIKTKENEFAVVFNIHHIITDGWSMEILKQEFHQLYNAYKNEVPYHLESVTIQYKDFAAWHNRLLSNKEQLQKAQDFWKEQLSGNLPPLSLPYQGARLTENKDSSGYRTVIPGDTLDRLRLIAEERQASLFMLLLTAFNMLLAKVTGQKEIIMAIPAAARKYEELRNIIGMFVNVLILRNTVSMNESFPDFFKRLQANTFRVLEYQDFPLELIFGQLGMPYPEISVFFNMLNLGTAPRQDIIDLVSHHIEKVQNAKFDIVCYLAEYKNGIEINCHYFKDLFKPATIEMLMKEYIKTLTNISADPTRYLREYFISGKKRQLKRGDT